MVRGKEAIKADTACSGARLAIDRAAGHNRRAGRGRNDGDRNIMASGNDMKAHSATYEGFIGMLYWSVPLVAVIAAGVVWLIS